MRPLWNASRRRIGRGRSWRQGNLLVVTAANGSWQHCGDIFANTVPLSLPSSPLGGEGRYLRVQMGRLRLRWLNRGPRGTLRVSGRLGFSLRLSDPPQRPLPEHSATLPHLPARREMTRSEVTSSEGRGAREARHPEVEWPRTRGERVSAWGQQPVPPRRAVPSPCPRPFPLRSSARGLYSPLPHTYPVSHEGGEA